MTRSFRRFRSLNRLKSAKKKKKKYPKRNAAFAAEKDGATRVFPKITNTAPSAAKR